MASLSVAARSGRDGAPQISANARPSPALTALARDLRHADPRGAAARLRRLGQAATAARRGCRDERRCCAGKFGDPRFPSLSEGRTTPASTLTCRSFRIRVRSPRLARLSLRRRSSRTATASSSAQAGGRRCSCRAFGRRFPRLLKRFHSPFARQSRSRSQALARRRSRLGASGWKSFGAPWRRIDSKDVALETNDASAVQH